MQNGMQLKLSIVKFILNLKKEDFDKLEGFIHDFLNCFNGAKHNYWEFEEWAKIKLGLLEEKQPSISFFPIKNKKTYDFDDNIIKNYSSLLLMILSTNNFLSLYSHISGKKNINDFIEFINYLKDNYEKKEQFKKCINKLESLGIHEFYYNNEFNFDGIYKVTMDYVLNKGVYSDGNKQWLSKVGISYPVAINGANYVIRYNKGKGMSRSVCMELKNLEFDINTLPTKEDLYDYNTVHPEIDYNSVEIKTTTVDVLYELNSCCTSVDGLINLSDELVKKLKNSNMDGNSEFETKLSILRSISADLKQLNEALINESDKQEIIPKDELESSFVRKKEYIDSLLYDLD